MTEPTAVPTVSTPQPEPTSDQTVAWNNAVRRAAASSIIASSGLPLASRERLAGQDFATPEAVEAAIQNERTYLAQLVENNVVQIGAFSPRSSNIQMGLTGT